MEKGSQQELEQRLALGGPEDTLRGLFFTGALEVVRGLEEPAALERCIEASGAERFMTFFSYPVGTLNRLLYAAAWELSGRHDGFSGAMRYLGNGSPVYLQSGAGRVLLMLAGGEPRRMLDGIPSAYRTAVQHGLCSVQWAGPARGRVIFQGSTLPAEYLEGAVPGPLRVLEGGGGERHRTAGEPARRGNRRLLVALCSHARRPGGRVGAGRRRARAVFRARSRGGTCAGWSS